MALTFITAVNTVINNQLLVIRATVTECNSRIVQIQGSRCGTISLAEKFLT